MVLLSNRGTPLTSTSRFAAGDCTGDVGDGGDCVGVDSAGGVEGDACRAGDDGNEEVVGTAPPFVCGVGDVGDVRSSGGGGELDDELAPDADELDGEESDEIDEEVGPIPEAPPIGAGCCGGELLECGGCVRANKGDPVMDRL